MPRQLPHRAKAIIIRMTEEEHARLMDEAAREGVTMQVLGERRMLGYADAMPRKACPQPRPVQSEGLPLTG